MAEEVRDKTVGDVFNLVVQKPATVWKGEPLRNAVDAMISSKGSQKVYVVDRKGILAGVITMESLLKNVGGRIGARKDGMMSFFSTMSSLLKETVDDFMQKPVTIRSDMMLTEAVKMMIEHRLNDLPVVDEKGSLVGELNGLEILTAARKLYDAKPEA